MEVKKVVDNSEQVEIEEQAKPGIIAELMAKVNDALVNWVDRKMAEKQKELWNIDKQNITAGMKNFGDKEAETQKESDKSAKEAEKSKEAEKTEEAETLKGIEKIKKKFLELDAKMFKIKEESLANWNNWRERALLKKIDLAIREESRAPNYFNLSVSRHAAAGSFFLEERAINNAFTKYRNQLEEYFSKEEIYQLKLKFQERARLMDELRQEGLNFRVGKINRLKTLETYFGVKSAESMRFFDFLEIELKAKQRVRGLDKRIANEHRLEISEDTVRIGTGIHKERQASLQQFWTRAVLNEKVTKPNWEDNAYSEMLRDPNLPPEQSTLEQFGDDVARDKKENDSRSQVNEAVR
ncbi:MAG: hypothetical protein PHX01_01985 [Clostridia bacterium]|nr:hypothetical protein [Clostridia bacterium]